MPRVPLAVTAFGYLACVWVCLCVCARHLALAFCVLLNVLFSEVVEFAHASTGGRTHHVP